MFLIRSLSFRDLFRVSTFSSFSFESMPILLTAVTLECVDDDKVEDADDDEVEDEDEEEDR